MFDVDKVLCDSGVIIGMLLRHKPEHFDAVADQCQLTRANQEQIRLVAKWRRELENLIRDGG